MEKELNYSYPLVDMLKNIQDPKHLVPEWTHGGEDTRSYKNRTEFSYSKMVEKIDEYLTQYTSNITKQVELNLPKLDLPKLKKV